MLDNINKILWGIATIFLVTSGVYFSIKTHFVQFKFKEMFRGFKVKGQVKITPFQSLMMATAARIGVGSLAGVALAIYVGGIGSIFWLWISSIITAPNAFVESCLGVIYKEKAGIYYKGGPSYYIDKGLGKKGLAKLYSILIMIAYLLGFLTIQANTITKSIITKINLPPLLIGIIIALIAGSIIIKGVKGIAETTGKLVPLMGIGYLIVSIFIILVNIDKIPLIFLSIIKEAFNFKSLGAGVISSMIIGVQRGIFSSEAGIGSGAIASATSDSNNPVGQGLIQILGIYFTSLIVCTSTAFIILTSNYTNFSFHDINGIEIIHYALDYHLGNIGQWILIIAIILFAFSTVITGYYYGESGLQYLYPKCKSKHLLYLKIITLILLIYGSIASANFLWKIVDIFVAIMAIINIYSIMSMRKDIQYEWDQYKIKKQHKT